MWRFFKGKSREMKNKLAAGLGLSLLVILSACNPLKLIEKYLDEIKIVANPEILQVHGNSVEYSLRGKIPPKAFHKKGVATITPVVYYSGGSTKLEPIMLKGEKAEGSGRTISLKNGGSFELSGSFDYDPKMEGKDLYVDLNISICKSGTDVCKEFSKEKVALGIITTSRSVKGDEEVFFAGDFKPVKRNFKRSIFFLINQSTVRTSEKRGKAVEELKEFAATERMELQGITINSYASPDGELRINQNLTLRRSESSYKFLTGLLKKLDNPVSSGDLYKKQSLEEDWDGFRKLVQASSLPDKSEVLAIINSKKSNDDKETAIKALASWPTILDEMMPQLRRSDIILSGVVKNRTMEELKAAAASSLDGFTVKELLFYAHNSKDSKDKIAAYKAYIAKKPKSIVGYNNMAAVQINDGDYKSAQKTLEKGIKEAGDNDSLQLNMGIVHRHNDDLEAATASYTRAARANVAAGYNMGIVHILNGNYDEAIESIPSSKCDYNAALAQLLKGNYEDAVAKINCQKTLTADDYYLRAIAYARQSNTDDMGASLKLAVEADASMAAKATNDMEFHSYWSDNVFKNAIGK